MIELGLTIRLQYVKFINFRFIQLGPLSHSLKKKVRNILGQYLNVHIVYLEAKNNYIILIWKIITFNFK